MSSLVSKLLYGSSGSSQNQSGGGPQTTHHLVIRPSPQISSNLLVQPMGAAINVPPIFTFADNGSAKVFYRGEANQSNFLGQLTTHGLGSKAKLSLRGQDLVVKANGSGNYRVETPNFGRFKWKPNSLTGTGLYLHDESGTKVAAFKSNGVMNMGEKQLLVYVPCDGYFLEMVVFTALAAKAVSREEGEVAGEVVNALAGA